MAFVVVRKDGKSVLQKQVDDELAKKGFRIRVGTEGNVHLKLGQSKTVGKYTVTLYEGQPSEDAYHAVDDLKKAVNTFPPIHVPQGTDVTVSADSAEAEGGKYPRIEGFEITGRLGEGGMGTVWRGIQLSTKREVAIKFLASHRFSSQQSRARFEREVALAAKLNHPSIARIYDSGIHRGVYYYAMELIDGVHLDKFVQREELSIREIITLMRDICDAICHAHEHGVIHRDIKPSNIMVTFQGKPVIVDFGLAKSCEQENEDVTISIEGDITGTPAYMAPEQAAGHIDQISERTDVYALGILMYQFLTGCMPHDLSGSRYDVVRRIVEEEVKSPRIINPAIDGELESILLTCLAKEPNDRYPSSKILLQDVDNYLRGEPLLSKSFSTTYRISKRIHKYKMPLVFTALFLLVIGIIIVTACLLISKERKKWLSTIEKTKPLENSAAIIPADKKQPTQETASSVQRETNSTSADTPVTQSASEKVSKIVVVESQETISTKVDSFKYGLYLHFDISTFAGYIGAENIGRALPERYAPTNLDVRSWIRMAKQAGMDFAVLAVKHEAGFCLWDSKDYDYDVASSPVKTDVVAQFVNACKVEGIKPGVHYSIPDAHNEGEVRSKGPVDSLYFDQIKKHTVELHTRYPDIRLELFDGTRRLSQEQLRELTETVKRLNPQCEIWGSMNEGLGTRYGCNTINIGWFWSPTAQLTPTQQLFEHYFQARAREGLPFLLNAAPDRSGRIPEQYVAVLMELKGMIEQNPSQSQTPQSPEKPMQAASPNQQETTLREKWRKAMEDARVEFQNINDRESMDFVGKILDSLDKPGGVSPSALAAHASRLESKTRELVRKGALESAAIHNYAMWSARVIPGPGADAPARVGQQRLSRSPSRADGLVLYMPFDAPPTNSMVLDESGTGNHGRVEGAQWVPEGHFGGAYQFHITNLTDRIVIPDSNSLNPKKVTVTAWIKASDSDGFWNRIVDKDWRSGYTLSLGGDFNGKRDRGRLILEANSKSIRSDHTLPRDGRWQHVAGTFDGETIKLYVDGVEKKQTFNNSSPITGNHWDLCIGNSVVNYGTGEFLAFDGLIDEVRIYNRVLSAEEIQTLTGASQAGADIVIPAQPQETTNR